MWEIRRSDGTTFMETESFHEADQAIRTLYLARLLKDSYYDETEYELFFDGKPQYM